MGFILSNEHISYQLSRNNYYENAMNLSSFLMNGDIFSFNKDLPNSEWKNQWMLYNRVIMPHSGFKIEYSHPYKSDKFKNITDYTITNGSKFIDGGQTHCLENAESQAYIKISQLSSFTHFFKLKRDKIDWILEKIDSEIAKKTKYGFFRSNWIESDRYNNSYYRISTDLNYLIENKSILREYKLAQLIDENK